MNEIEITENTENTEKVETQNGNEIKQQKKGIVKVRKGRPSKKQKEIESLEGCSPVVDSLASVEVANRIKLPEIACLYKTTSKTVATKLILENADVKHISGCGTRNDPKIWFILAFEKDISKLDAEDRLYLSEASYAEIEQCIGKSIDRANEEQIVMGVRKTQVGRRAVPYRTM